MQRICVFTGSSVGTRSDYALAARSLARELVSRELGLVYGGANVGLMGILANAVLDLGGHVIGVIPESLAAEEVAHEQLSELRIVNSMHERKAQMAELSSGFIALPGGVGTLEEIFEIFTWAQLGLHRKPCGLLDVQGYFDLLIAFLDHGVNERFLKPEHRGMLLVEQDPGRLLDAFNAYTPPDLGKWIGRD
ncbi:TIGR00730 family Rossman fold protein [Myxococcota bacterium]|nr:TIGR00730 family Rossman fold protein [Myxococcota bacterium]